MMNELNRPSPTPFIDIESPYGNNTELFNNASSFPDLELVVQGLESPLLLHRCILVGRSKLFQALINVKVSAGTPNSNTVEWMFSTEKEVNRQSLMRVLRFCYGERMRIKADCEECCSLISTLKQLRVTCGDEIVKQIKDFVIDQSKKDVLFGTKTLLASQCYPECCSDDCKLHTLLARVVLTRERICENYGAVVSDCLMKLPPEFLEYAVYGEPHTVSSEFNIRVEYVRCNSEMLNKEDKQHIVGCCDFNKLNIHELRQLKELGLIEGEAVTRLYEKSLENAKKERDEYKRRYEESEREKAQMAHDCEFHDNTTPKMIQHIHIVFMEKSQMKRGSQCLFFFNTTMIQ